MAGQARRDRIAEWEEEHPEEGKRYRAARRKVKATFVFASNSGVYPRVRRGPDRPRRQLAADGPAVRRTVRDDRRARWPGRLHHPDRDRDRRWRAVPVRRASPAAAPSRRCTTSRTAGSSSQRSIPGRSSACSPWQVRHCVSRAPGTRSSCWTRPSWTTPRRCSRSRPEEIALINPNTGTLPIFRSRRDAALTAEIYQRIPVLWDERKTDGNPWGITFKNLFNMTDDSDLFRTREQLGEGRLAPGRQRLHPATGSGCCRCTRRRWSTSSTTGPLTW